MASNQDHAILDLGIDDLQFTTNDYKSYSNTGGNSNEQGAFTSFPDPDPQTNRDTDRIIDDEGSGTTRSSYFKMSFYQQYFDVEDKDIFNRLLYSMLPVPGKSFLQHHIRPKADLYGPFWTCVTLIFSIAISGNVADYFISSDGKAWQYDFHKVNLAATAVFSYTGLVPACLFGYLWWAGQGGGSLAISFVEMVCVYGYSLVIYIPVSILWLACVKLSWLQWMLVLLAASLSGIVLFTTIWPAVRESAPKSCVFVMVVVLGLHFLLATGFMLYFFHDSGSGDAGPDRSVTTVIPVPHNNNVTAGPSHAALVQDHTEATLNAISSFDPDKVANNKTSPTPSVAPPTSVVDSKKTTVDSSPAQPETNSTSAVNSTLSGPTLASKVTSSTSDSDGKPTTAESTKLAAGGQENKNMTSSPASGSVAEARQGEATIVQSAVVGNSTAAAVVPTQAADRSVQPSPSAVASNVTTAAKSPKETDNERKLDVPLFLRTSSG